uniref:Uncharacterized protein n=1 Tax=Pelagomonas calceolata TaxID=35677 RepID=A0A7S4E9S4_9STRA
MIDAVASGAVALRPSLEAVHALRVDATQEPLDAARKTHENDADAGRWRSAQASATSWAPASAHWRSAKASAHWRSAQASATSWARASATSWARASAHWRSSHCGRRGGRAP